MEIDDEEDRAASCRAQNAECEQQGGLSLTDATQQEAQETTSGMTLDAAIAHTNAKANATPCGREHQQLAGWLMELKSIKKGSGVCGGDGMNKAEVIRLAQEAGATIRQGHRLGVVVYENGGDLSPLVLERFAGLVAAAARERCALIAVAARDGYAERSGMMACAADFIVSAIRGLKDEVSE